MNKIKKAFTIIELVIVIGIIGILSAVLIPTVINTYQDTTTEIVSIYNGLSVECYYYDELFYEGMYEEMPSEIQERIENYFLKDIEYSDNCVKMYYIDK